MVFSCEYTLRGLKHRLFNEFNGVNYVKMNENKGTYEIDAMQIIGMLLKRWWVIVLAAVLCAGLAFGYTEFFVTPTYQADATLIINGGSSLTTTYQEILAGQYQSKDYPYILNANLTLEEIASRLNEYDFAENGGEPYRHYTASVLSGMISTEAIEDSRIFRVIVTSQYPEETRIIANTVVEVFPARVESLIRGGSVGIVDLAITPTSPSSPSYSRNLVLGFAIGFVFGVIGAIVVGFANDTLDSDNWLLQRYRDEIPLLATIPDANSKNDGMYYRYKYKYSRSYGYSSSQAKKQPDGGK